MIRGKCWLLSAAVHSCCFFCTPAEEWLGRGDLEPLCVSVLLAGICSDQSATTTGSEPYSYTGHESSTLPARQPRHTTNNAVLNGGHSMCFSESSLRNFGDNGKPRSQMAGVPLRPRPRVPTRLQASWPLSSFCLFLSVCYELDLWLNDARSACDSY